MARKRIELRVRGKLNNNLQLVNWKKENVCHIGYRIQVLLCHVSSYRQQVMN